MSEPQTPSVLDDLSNLEQAVVDAARRGVLVEPATVVEVEELAVTEDPELRVRAEVIRELLMGRWGELDPRGVRVQGVRVVGEQDLDHVKAVTGLEMVNCALPEGVVCRFARLREMNLSNSRVSALNADGLRARCDLDTATRWGQAFTYAIWALQALVWALATLAIAAYTGLVRKPA